MAYGKKYGAASQGIWNWIREKLVLVPNRSSGNLIPGVYRTPPPGEQPTDKQMHDVFTLPASDIAENSYSKRDFRRNYPQTSVLSQSTIAGLLLYGSVGQSRLAKGEAGTKQLATIANHELSLSSVLQSKEVASEVLEKTGLPPLPPNLHPSPYRLLKFEQHGMYPDSSTMRVFH